MVNPIPDITKNQMDYMMSIKEKEKVEVKGIIVNIQPYMFPPKSPYSYSTRILLDNMDLNDERVLEIGAGCGILSIFAAKQGAYVDGVDILPECIRFSLGNAIVNDVFRNTRFYYSDMFSNVESRYDTIICNLPILNGELPDKNPLWYSLFDPGFKSHKELFAEGSRFASKIIMAHADLICREDFTKIESLALEYGWDSIIKNETAYAGHRWRCYEFGFK